jgi:APA family basic amino acid/polyamine antiporter
MLYARVGFSLLDPAHAQLGESRLFLLSATLALVWLALGSNVIGLQVGKWAENIGALATAGTVGLLVAIAWLVWTRRGSATPMDITPAWNWGTVSFWAAIAYAMSGMEAPAMMAAETRDPERTMRRAGWIASALAAVLYVGATIAFLVVLPPGNISELNGYEDLAAAAGRLLGAGWLSPLIAVLVLTSGVGFIGGIGTATARLSFAAATDGLLPGAFARVHPTWKTPHVSILALGVVATALLVVYQLGDSLRAAYDELVSLMVITGFLPYLYIFASGWKAGKRLSAMSGGAVTVLALACAAVPPDGITNVWLFEGKLAAGTLAVGISAWLVYRGRQRDRVAIGPVALAGTSEP